MKVLITGAGGQLATELVRTAPQGLELVVLSRADLDISQADSVQSVLAQHQADAIINAAAYTAVDKAESDVDTAYAVNEKGIQYLAQYASPSCYLLHISTDFVFDGEACRPYLVSTVPSPNSVYGASKLAGEKQLLSLKPENSAIIRTSWVYSTHGHNFVKSMLRFIAEREALNIVVDQVGTPTWAKGLATVCWAALEEKLSGLYHWSDAGVASWYDFAEAIKAQGLEHGLIEDAATLKAIPTSAYPLPAQRPAYSVLDKSALLEALPSIENTHWQEQLSLMFKELVAETN